MRGGPAFTRLLALPLTVLLTLLPAIVLAQVQTMPVAVCAEPLRVAGAGGGALIDDLSTLYNTGRRDELRARIVDLIARIRAAYPEGCPEPVPGTNSAAGALARALDPGRHYIAVHWVAADPVSGRTLLVRVVLHGTGPRARLEHPDANLPGIGTSRDGPQLIELFIGRSPGGVMSSVYTSKREGDPADAQMVRFAQALAGPMFGAVGAIAGGVRQGAAAPGEDLWATIAVIALPHPRATVRVQMAARDTVTTRADVTFHNRPLTHWSFGAGAAVIAAASISVPRADLDSAGAIVADPLPRVLTMAHVNWSPRGYDDGAPRLARAERYRLFVGAALTPDFGIVSGVNVLLVRGVGISAGVAVLFSKGADGGAIGEPPPDPAQPFRLTVPAAWFIGLTWNAK